MTVNDLKLMVDALVKEGHGNKELRMDTDPSDEHMFDIEFIERLGDLEEGLDDYIGVRTNDNH
jgi:hypothetical protein